MLSDYIAFNFTKSKKQNIKIHPLYTYRDTYCKDIKQGENSNDMTMLDCLNKQGLATIIGKMTKYYTNGNPNFAAIILSPKDVYVHE